jgi:hypothetical protein
MTDDKWQCVKISKNGWELLDKTPIPMFTRYKQTSQAEPDRNYQEDILDRFLQLTNLKEEEDKILLSVYIMTLYPRYSACNITNTWREGKRQVNTSNTHEDISRPW